MILQGSEYVSRFNKLIPAKQFEAINSCCVRHCFQNIDGTQQQEFFNAFWNCSEGYNAQNIILCGLMTMKPPSTIHGIDSTVTLWEYSFHFLSDRITVCQNFLCKLLKINKGRFAYNQKKLKNNKMLDDDRGKHTNHVKHLSEDLMKTIKEHCLLIPHSKSHYKLERSSLNYFDHPDLTLTELCKLFV